MTNKKIISIIVLSTIILFICSSVRHILFQSAAADLGIFDQGLYLISQGKPAIPSLLGFHLLADHAAWLWYPISLLYKIYPSVYWLFALQAFILASGALPTWYLARYAGLKAEKCLAVVIAYLLYPLVFNVNLFDFHLDVLAPSAFLYAVLMARLGKVWWFCCCIFLVMGCKEVFALTVAAMGVWLILFEKKRLYGAIALICGVGWFAIALNLIIPFFGEPAAAITRHIHRYSSLGNSFGDIAKNFLLQPQVLLQTLFSLNNLIYLILLVAPVLWGFSLPGIAPMISAIPCLTINLLATPLQQKDIVFQYSLPILPFLILVVIQSLASGKGLLQNQRGIILWSLISFLILGKYSYFWSSYLKSIDNWYSTNQAIAQVQTQGSVYTTAAITPHLTHRKLIQFTNADLPQNLSQFDYILLNTRHPGWLSNQQLALNIVNQLQNQSQFYLKYHQDDVYLFINSQPGK
ncbi:DUF2079 domain-containing protein [Nostoc sp. KVJ3]|uniref:DUF2079 domain-containing protein n=1 Tax=Nostoc sp. KVJ3 TaxID=457945 RepID=UPI002237083E|nr:DUF2079 domain-containing protein [Nostoc sp. KVJ3]MCW5317332.1 DUF2079 domain-containing protein [Nostoc sp. KVJ3]